MRNITRTTPRPRSVLLLIVATFALLSAACGDNTTAATAAAADDGVASINEDANSDAGTIDSTDSSDDASVLEAPENPEDAFGLFNQCMNHAGVGFGGVIVSGPDGADGGISISPDGELPKGDDPQRVEVSPEDFDLDAFSEANEICRGHLANIDQGFDLSPDQQARMDDAQLEFNKCMEDQGVEMPDFSGGGIVTFGSGPVEADPQTGQPSIDNLEFEEFNEAMETCQHIFEELNAEFGPDTP
jgi:hypothetical protein